jgi:two-component system, chemotaxis family, protein-glutamate methylesterase/glutaminase
MVVDDSVVIRGLLSRWLSEEDGIEVVASHRNGALAVNDVLKSNPDLVVLDIEMPEMDGMEALPKLLKLKPNLSVVMASTLTERNAKISLEALALGAKDYIPKPSGNHGITTSVEFRRDLVSKVHALGGQALRMARISTGIRPQPADVATIPRQAMPATAASTGFSLRPLQRVKPKVLAIGCSTGGPSALREFMTPGLVSAMRRIPVLLTQHMPATFTALLAAQLGEQTGLKSAEGVDGEMLIPGHLYVAPGGRHMVLRPEGNDVRIALEDGPMVNFCKPSVDPLFKTVAAIYRNAVLGIILTGMGEDGAGGSETIVENGGNIMAQDEETSVVWGMPGAVAKRGVCAAVLPLNELSVRTASILGGNFG